MPADSVSKRPDVSIVIPMKDEVENARPLLAEVAEVCADRLAWEVIVVDDGSTDGTGQVVKEMMRTCPQIRLLRHPQSAGQSAAIHSGVMAARAGIICTMDGDGQSPPGELPKLWGPLMAADRPPRLALVAGQRKRRRDTLSKRLASRFANWLRGAILRDGTRDTGCGLKGFRRDAFLALPYFDHMHRYLPALFRRDGWDIVHADVADRPRRAGRSKYSNFGRAIVGISDLAGVAWLIRRRKKAQPLEITPAEQKEASDG